MTRPVEPAGPIPPIGGGDDGRERRRGSRRHVDRREVEPSKALVPVAPVVEEPAQHAPGPAGDAAAFAAQVLGQGGQRRGIKGGPPVLDAARSTYLGAQYSGRDDRRPKPGKARDDDV